jgi:hypothetical protein
MGEMAEAYGFYEPTGEGGEVLTVVDHDEAWILAVVRAYWPRETHYFVIIT